MTQITNTSAEPITEKMLTALLPQGIEASERRGQEELVASDYLPTDARPNRAAFEALGFKFADHPCLDDPLFTRTQLPDGWVKRGSDHDMLSYIDDADGVERVSVFYKAAFYDRKADMRLVIPE